MSDDRLGLAEQYLYITAVLRRQPFFIISHRAGRSSCYDELVVLVLGESMHLCCKFGENRHHGADLSLAGTCQHGDERAVFQTVCRKEFRTGHAHGRGTVDSIHKRIAFIDVAYAFCVEIWLLERKYYEEHVNICLEFPDTAFAGCPHLRSNVVEYLVAGLVREFSNLEVEAGVVYKDHHVRVPVEDVLFAELYVLHQFPGLGQYLHESHHSSFLVVAHQCWMLGVWEAFQGNPSRDSVASHLSCEVWGSFQNRATPLAAGGGAHVVGGFVLKTIPY